MLYKGIPIGLVFQQTSSILPRTLRLRKLGSIFSMLYQALLLLASLCSLTSQIPLNRRAFSAGPVITQDFPDPAYIQVDGTFYAFATSNGQQNIQIATSPDFTTWTLTGKDALPNLPTWSNGATWAPDVIQIDDGTFVMYFAALYTNSNMMHCVGTATASAPEGPYTPSDTPFACPLPQGGAIDAAGFQDTDGTRYVVYKIDSGSLGGGGLCGNGDLAHGTPVLLQAVAADGVTPMGNATQILDRDAADGPLIEAPYLILHSGTYFLFFSSNCFNGPDYDTSYATASAITGPYTKTGTPLLVSGGDNGALNSPGGASVSPDGTQIVFHADETADNATVRQMWTAGIVIDGTTVNIS